MTTYVLATVPSSAEFEQILNDQAFVSLTGAVQVAARTGNRWRLTLNFRNLTGATRRALWGELAQLRGMQHRLQFDLSSANGYASGGARGGTPLLNGAHGSGATSIAVDGMPNSTNVLDAGDFLQIGNELKMVTADVTTNGSGEASIGIWPELHANYADNAPIDYDSPGGVFILEQGAVLPAEQFRANDWLSSVTISLIEDVLA